MMFDQGVELVEGGWNDAASIKRALRGDVAFAMLPPI
jgi:uncharacterized protein YbjT (DUF2867 family)